MCRRPEASSFQQPQPAFRTVKVMNAAATQPWIAFDQACVKRFTTPRPQLCAAVSASARPFHPTAPDLRTSRSMAGERNDISKPRVAFQQSALTALYLICSYDKISRVTLRQDAPQQFWDQIERRNTQ